MQKAEVRAVLAQCDPAGSDRILPSSSSRPTVVLAVQRWIQGLSVLTLDTLGLQSLIVSEGNVGPNKRVIIPKIYPQIESDAWQ
jgi:hypothetical protein